MKHNTVTVTVDYQNEKVTFTDLCVFNIGLKDRNTFTVVTDGVRYRVDGNQSYYENITNILISLCKRWDSVHYLYLCNYLSNIKRKGMWVMI